jgi:lipopolysaccharide export LptBFGC system permease protein LptF
LTPFFSLATLLFFASYANHQWLSPDAGNEAHAFRETISSHKKSKKEKVFSLSLKDDSELVYQNYSQETKELSDVYWIRSPDNIWHMKCLKINTKPPLASFADHLIRNNQGQFEKDESFALRSFPELPWEKGVVLQKFIPFENRSLTTLFKQAFSFSSERHALFSHLYYKLALAWIPFIILLSIAPRVFFFSRGKSFFLFVAYSLFVLLGFITLLNGMLILSENQVLFPSVAIWGPVALALFLTIRPFWRLL